MWIARNENAQLNLFLHKPIRNEYFGLWVDPQSSFVLSLNGSLFSKVTWGDEPVEVELKIKEK